VSAVEVFIERAERLPAAPVVVLKVLELARSDGTSANQVAELVQRDPTLSARLLKLANSAFFGLRGQVDTARRAVVVLGLKTVTSMAMVVWTHTLSLATKDRTLQAVYQHLFRHGLAVAVLARGLAIRRDPAMREAAFQAGLLHDIGRVALCAELGSQYWEGILDLSRGGCSFADAVERKRLDFDHAEVGAALMRQWGLPSALIEAAAAHHTPPDELADDVIGGAVAFGNLLARRQGWDLLPAAWDGLPGEAMERFKLRGEGELEELLTTSGAQLAQLASAVR
jgi:putative nucleotidyltransferase with HDIG domain